jgi:formylglycine-generating enzyme required for sulfatase activity
LREAKAVAKVGHDNVVTIFEADERDGVPYIAMQFLQGAPLDEYLKKKGSPGVAQCVRIVREAALGLAAAHARGLVHRDIKPANLWLEAPNGRVKVLDFGLTKPIGTDSELTKSGAVVGTPSYMSPEQARGQKVDARTDIFSLGAVLYRLLTGRNPFVGDHIMAVLTALAVEEPTPVRELNPNVPEALADLVNQLLAKKPEARPQTAAEVAERLRTILSQPVADVSVSMPVVVQPLPVPMHVSAVENAFANLTDDEEADDRTEREAEPVREPAAPKRGKGLLLAGGALALVAVVGVAIALGTGGKKPDETAKNDPPPAPPPAKKDTGKDKLQAPVAFPATYTNGIGMEFVRVPKGAAWLGGGGGEVGQTEVVFEQDFYIGKYEVTQAEWEAVMGTNPSRFSRRGGGKELVKGSSDEDLKRFPVECVSWHDCHVFVERLNSRLGETGWVYRLPKEAEWEYACRCGPKDKAESAFDFYFAKPTNTLLPEQANFNPGTERALNRTCKVGSYQPNALGIHDMHGNVWEWCADVGDGEDGTSHRVNRGGDWNYAADSCRAARRFTAPPSLKNDAHGLRLARVPVRSAPSAVTLTPESATDWSKWWVAQGEQSWKLQDGKLMNGNSARGWIGTRTKYTDFELELD